MAKAVSHARVQRMRKQQPCFRMPTYRRIPPGCAALSPRPENKRPAAIAHGGPPSPIFISEAIHSRLRRVCHVALQQDLHCGTLLCAGRTRIAAKEGAVVEPATLTPPPAAGTPDEL